MSLQIKALKNSMGTEEYTTYLQMAKKYFTTYSQLMKTETGKNLNQTNLNQSNTSYTSNISSNNYSSENCVVKSQSQTLAQRQQNISPGSNTNHFSETNSFSGELVRDEIINWLFSLPIESRIKIATVENSWVTNMINQMFFHYKCDNKSVFQMKNTELFEDKENEKDSKSNISISSGKYKDKDSNMKSSNNYKSICFKQGDISQFKDEDMYQSNLMNFFNFRSNKNSDIEMIEQILINDVYFYSVHSVLDCMTIGVRVMKDEILFRYYFQYIGSQYSFASLIKPNYDKQGKFYFYNLPDWFNPSEYNSIGKYILAYLEQTIIVKFVLNYSFNKKDMKVVLGNNQTTGNSGNNYIRNNLQNNNSQNNGNKNIGQNNSHKNSQTYLPENCSHKNSMVQIHSFINEEKLSQVFIDRKNIITFLNKNYSTEEEKKELISLINPGRIYNEIIHDKKIKETMKLKDRHQEVGYRSFVSRRFAHMEPFFTGKTDSETKDKIQEQLVKNHPILFLDKTIFISLDLVWKIDYFLGKRILDILQDMYTDRNAKDLIKDLEDEICDINKTTTNSKSSNQNSKKGKKNKKGTKTGTTKNNGNAQNTEKNNPKISITENSAVSSFAKDPDYEFYIPYLDDNKNQHNSITGNTKYHPINSIYSNTVSVNRNHVPTTIINLNTGEVKTDRPMNGSKEMTLTNYYKEKLVDSYHAGNAKMIEDFMKNYVIHDLIEKVVTIAKSPKHKTRNNSLLAEEKIPDIIAKNDFKDYKICDGGNSERDREGKNNFKLSESEGIKISIDDINFATISEQKTIITENDSRITIRKEDKFMSDDIVNYESKENDLKFEEKLEEINMNDIITQEQTSENNPNAKYDTNGHIFVENIENNNLFINEEKDNLIGSEIPITIEHKNRKSKKQKEPKFFLYDTTKKKKEKNTGKINNKNNTSNTNNSNTNKTNVIKKKSLNEIELDENNTEKRNSLNDIDLVNKDEKQKSRTLSENLKDSNNNNEKILLTEKELSCPNTLKNIINKSNETNDKRNSTNLEENPSTNSIVSNLDTANDPNLTSNTINIICDKYNNNNDPKILIIPENENKIDSSHLENRENSIFNSVLDRSDNEDSNNGSNKICSNSSSININGEGYSPNSKKIINQHPHNLNIVNQNNLNNNLNSKSPPYKQQSINYRHYPKTNYTQFNQTNYNNLQNLNYPHSHPSNGDPNIPIIRNNYYIFNTITQVSNSNSSTNITNNLGNITNMTNLTNLTNLNNFNHITNPSPSTNNHMVMYIPNSSTTSHGNNLSLHLPVQTPNQTNINNISLNKYSNDFLTFVYKLHNDMLTYHKNVSETLEYLKEIKIFAINYIEKLISSIISENFLVDVYGSFASDLSIESSDIDMKIRLKNSEAENNFEFDLDEMIITIVKNFNNRNLFDSVIPIYTASVPIIKIVIDPYKIADDDNLLRLEEFRHSNFYKNYKFNKADIEKIKIDLTFLDMLGTVNGVKNRITSRVSSININMNTLTKTVPSLNQMSSVEYAKNIMIVYPEIKPLIQVLKRYLQLKKLNSCFNEYIWPVKILNGLRNFHIIIFIKFLPRILLIFLGGLSSFCLFLLILAFLKYKKFSQQQVSQNNLGRLLLDFLEFYGRIFNFHTCSVDVNLPNPFVLKNEIYDSSPIILDPLSYNNASKSSYRIDEVRETFAEAFSYLNQLKLKYDKIDVHSNTNIIYDLLFDKNI